LPLNKLSFDFVGTAGLLLTKVSWLLHSCDCVRALVLIATNVVGQFTKDVWEGYTIQGFEMW